MSQVGLPKGWVKCQLKDIISVNPKVIANDEDLSGFIPMSHAPVSFFDTFKYDERNWGEIKKKYTNFADGDVIFAKVTPCFENGKAALLEGLPNGIGAGSSEFYVLRPLSSTILSEYVFSIIKSAEFLTNGERSMTGAVGLRRVPRSFVENFEVNLPPLDEQQVIADKLDTLLAQVESIKARLERIPEILKQFRQSVLAAAVSGKLTEAWRVAKGITIATWKYEAAKNVCEKVQSGSTPRENPFDQDGTVPFLKVYNIVDQKIDFDYKPQFITSETHRKGSSARSVAFPNDVLMNIVGPPLGKVAILTNQFPEWNLNQAITLFRVKKELLDHKYLYYVLCEGALVRDVMPETKGSVGQVNISLSQCREAILPVPSIEEQREVVLCIDKLFNNADVIDRYVHSALNRVNNLTQSILAKAFRGELTVDWREANPELISGDNSAEALLGRIKVERELAKPATKRGRGKA